MMVTLLRHFTRWVQRRQFVKEVYRQLFALEVEREYFRNRYSVFMNDTFQEHIEILNSFLTAGERQKYEIVWKQKALQRFFVEIEDKIPQYIRNQILNNEQRFKYYDTREIVSLYCRVHKCKESLKDILTKL